MGRELRADTRIYFHDLSWRRRPHDWVVGYEPTGSFTTVEETGRKLIFFLQKNTVGTTRSKFPEYDIDEFVHRLAEKGLIHRIGHKRLTNHKHLVDVIDINPKHIAWVNNPLVVALSVAIGLFGILLMLLEGSLQPIPAWFFAIQHTAVLLPVALIVWWVINALHEFGHYVTLRATGHEAGYTLINKWHLITPHANIQAARLLPTQARIRVLFAGITVDLLILTFSLVLIAFQIAPTFFKLVALLAFIELLFQFTPSRHSDVARILEQRMDIEDFNASMITVLKAGCPFCKQQLTPDAKRVAWLLPFYIISAILLAGLVLGYILPIILSILYHASLELISGAIAMKEAMFVDALLTLILCTLGLSFYFASLLRSHEHPSSKLFTWMVVILHLITDYIVIFLISVALLIYTSPVFASIALFILGVLFGVLLLRLLDHANLLVGVWRDYLIPLIVAFTALLLLILLGMIGQTTAALEPSALYAVAFAGGMLGSTLV